VEDEVEQIFDHYVGVGHLKDQFKALARRANALRRAGRDPVPFMPFHLIFKGPFGTGKTSAARKMGWLYKSMRLLATDEVVEVMVRGHDSRLIFQGKLEGNANHAKSSWQGLVYR
jgi:hypothetical protein